VDKQRSPQQMTAVFVTILSALGWAIIGFRSCKDISRWQRILSKLFLFSSILLGISALTVYFRAIDYAEALERRWKINWTEFPKTKKSENPTVTFFSFDAVEVEGVTTNYMTALAWITFETDRKIHLRISEDSTDAQISQVTDDFVTYDIDLLSVTRFTPTRKG
jgi:hypothetical protein